MKIIESVNNAQVKEWKKLHKRRQREKQNSYLIESAHLIEECIFNQPDQLKTLIIRDDIIEESETKNLISKVEDKQIYVVSPQIASAISSTKTNQGLFAQVEIVQPPIPTNFDQSILVLDAVQDPGNVGTMIRTASAAGYQAVFLGTGTADLYNDKTLRAAQGSNFQLDVYSGPIEEFIPKLKDKNIPVVATTLDEEALSYKEVEIATPYALIVGNEGAGISETIVQQVDKKIYIPMSNKVESLNVAIASSIVMFHLN